MTFTEIGANRNGYLNISERKRFGQEKKMNEKILKKDRSWMDSMEWSIGQDQSIIPTLESSKYLTRKIIEATISECCDYLLLLVSLIWNIEMRLEIRLSAADWAIQIGTLDEKKSIHVMIRNATGYRSTSVMDICEQIITSSMFLFLSPRIFSNCSRAIIQRSHTFCLFFLLLQHLFCCCSFYSFYFTVSSASRTDHFIWYVFESVCSVYFVCVEHKIYILLFGLIWTQTSSSWKWNETETTTEKKQLNFWEFISFLWNLFVYYFLLVILLLNWFVVRMRFACIPL